MSIDTNVINLLNRVLSEQISLTVSAYRDAILEQGKADRALYDAEELKAQLIATLNLLNEHGGTGSDTWKVPLFESLSIDGIPQELQGDIRI